MAVFALHYSACLLRMTSLFCLSHDVISHHYHAIAHHSFIIAAHGLPMCCAYCAFTSLGLYATLYGYIALLRITAHPALNYCGLRLTAHPTTRTYSPLRINTGLMPWLNTSLLAPQSVIASSQDSLADISNSTVSSFSLTWVSPTSLLPLHLFEE